MSPDGWVAGCVFQDLSQHAWELHARGEEARWGRRHAGQASGDLSFSCVSVYVFVYWCMFVCNCVCMFLCLCVYECSQGAGRKKINIS